MTPEERRELYQIDTDRRDDASVWQGDIVKTFARVEHRLLLVVSADCDLVHDKGGEVLCVPVRPISDHLTGSACLGVLEQCLAFELGEVRQAISAKSPELGNVPDEALLDWLRNRTLDNVKAEIPSMHPDVAEWVHLLGTRVCAFDDALNGSRPGFDAKFSQVADLLKLGKDHEKAKKKVSSSLSKVDSVIRKVVSPGKADQFVLPAVPGEDEALGFVVSFRRVVPVSRAMLVGSLREARQSSEPRFTVVARCRPSLTHAIVQKFSLFFSRVGIASGFEGDQTQLIQKIVDELTQ